MPATLHAFLSAASEASDPDEFIPFVQWLQTRVALSPETTQNYASAVNRILQMQETGEPVGEYLETRTIGWERSCRAAWKLYIQWARIYRDDEPLALDEIIGVSVPAEVAVAVDWLLSTFGLAATQRLHWAHVNEGATAVFDPHGSPLGRTPSDAALQEKLHKHLMALYEHFAPQDTSAAVIPRSQTSSMRSTRARLRTLREQVALAQRAIGPFSTRRSAIQSSKKQEVKAVPRSFPLPTAEDIEAAGAKFPTGHTPVGEPGESTGRAPRTKEELEADGGKPIADWALEGMTAEMTGHYPDGEDEAQEPPSEPPQDEPQETSEQPAQ